MITLKALPQGRKVDNILVGFQSACAAGTPTSLHSILWITVLPIFDYCLLSLSAKCKNHLILSCQRYVTAIFISPKCEKCATTSYISSLLLGSTHFLPFQYHSLLDSGFHFKGFKISWGLRFQSMARMIPVIMVPLHWLLFPDTCS